MTDVNDLSAGDPFAGYEGKTEPDCTICCDNGFVDDLTGETGTANCPDCNPTAEQAAASEAEWARKVASGEIPTVEESPF